MEKVKTAFNYRLSVLMAGLLSVVLLISANSASCCLIHQPEAPIELSKFSKIK